VLLLVFAAACGGPVQVPGQPADLKLTQATRDALDATFKKWQIATVAPQAVACQNGSAAPFVRGDLNSDGQPDLALAIKTAEGVHLVAVFERATDSTVVDVDSMGQEAADGAVGIQPRGGSFKNPDDALDDYFTADTLMVTRCGQPRTLYFWSGLGFRKVVLKPSAANSKAALLPIPQHAG
jgi:hypothetical protein